MVVQLKEGMNPRDHIPGHKERGPIRFTYTLQDVADVLGISMSTLRRRQAGGPFDPSILADVCRVYHYHRLHPRAGG